MHFSGIVCVHVYANVLQKREKDREEERRKERYCDFLGAPYWKIATTSRGISRLFGIQRVHKVDCAQPCSFCIMPGRDKHPGRWLFRSCHGCLSYSLYILMYSPLLNADGKIERIHRVVCTIYHGNAFCVSLKFNTGCLNSKLGIVETINVKQCYIVITTTTNFSRLRVNFYRMFAIFIKQEIIIVLIWKRYVDTIYTSIMRI